MILDVTASAASQPVYIQEAVSVLINPVTVVLADALLNSNG